MDGGAWWAAIYGVAQSRTQLSDFTFTFCFHALEKEMATHFSGLGSHRVGYDWSDLAAAAAAAVLIEDAFRAFTQFLWWPQNRQKLYLESWTLNLLLTPEPPKRHHHFSSNNQRKVLCTYLKRPLILRMKCKSETLPALISRLQGLACLQWWSWGLLEPLN